MYNGTMKRIMPITILLCLMLASCATWGDGEPTVAMEPLVEETAPVQEEAVVEQETVEEEQSTVEEPSAVDVLPVTDNPVGGGTEPESVMETVAETPEPLPEPLPEPTAQTTPENVADALPDTKPLTEEADAAKIGEIILPKWFVFAFSALFLALLAALCYMSDNRKKSLYYRGRD